MVLSKSEVIRLRDWFSTKNFDAPAGYVLGRYSLNVSTTEVAGWYRVHDSNFIAPVNIRDWIKNRLIDTGKLPHESKGCPEVRLFCYLHFDPIFDSIAPEDRYFVSTRLTKGIQRPAFHRLRSRRPIGITAAARKMVNEKLQTCPYCRSYFRNPAALVVHIEDRHAASIVRSLEK
jgi:hypothetical protein